MHSHPLSAHINKHVSLTEYQHEQVLHYCKEASFVKKEHLLKEGDICKNLYFVSRGCLRMYFVNEKGQEQTIQFAIEN